MGAGHDRGQGKRVIQREEVAAAARMSGQARQHLMDFGKHRGAGQRAAGADGSAGQITCLDVLAGQGEQTPHILVRIPGLRHARPRQRRSGRSLAVVPAR
jgi:hypothetical protein